MSPNHSYIFWTRLKYGIEPSSIYCYVCIAVYGSIWKTCYGRVERDVEEDLEKVGLTPQSRKVK